MSDRDDDPPRHGRVLRSRPAQPRVPEAARALHDAWARRRSGDADGRPAPGDAPVCAGTAAVADGRLGAWPHAGGTSFGVWAPHADSVHVVGSFNDWNDTAHAMERDDAGCWRLDIGGVGPGAEYKYAIRRGEQHLLRNDPRARQVTHSSGNSVVLDPAAFDWQGDDFQAPPLNELVIYELHVGSFMAPADGRPGTFDDVLDRLGHLERLGVNAIQLMPVAEFAGDYSWGYNPAHPFAVETAYGGPDALRRFVREAHRRGFAVILDVVYNHFGPGDLDLWQFDGWSEDGKGGIYFYNDHRGRTPWGDTRPDYGRGEVRQYIRDNALMWLGEYRVDGLRFDMTLYMRSIEGASDDLPDGWGLLQWINREVRARHPRAITIAEDLRNNEWLTRDVEAGGAGFHAQWDANFVHPVRATVIVADDAQRSMDDVRDAVTWRYGDDAFRRVVYSESHDEVANGQARVPQEIAPGDPDGWFAQKRSALAAGLVFTSPGVPMLFQGQEFLQGLFFRDDVPLDWDRAADFRGVVRLYRDLVRLRLNRDGVSRGLTGQSLAVLHVNDADDVIAFHRWHQGGPGDDVVVLMNFANVMRPGYVIGLPRPGHWRVRFNSDARAYGEHFGDTPAWDADTTPGDRDGQAQIAAFDLSPYGMLVLSQDADPQTSDG